MWFFRRVRRWYWDWRALSWLAWILFSVGAPLICWIGDGLRRRFYLRGLARYARRTAGMPGFRDWLVSSPWGRTALVLLIMAVLAVLVLLVLETMGDARKREEKAQAREETETGWDRTDGDVWRRGQARFSAVHSRNIDMRNKRGG